MCLARIAATLSAALLIGAGPADDGTWVAGGYSFSDEMGEFRILDIAGTGTRSDPIVLTQELYTASAEVLVIRTVGPRPRAETDRTGMVLYLQLETLNASGLAWVEFGFELQEQLGKPSTYGDGFSFDQVRTERGTISSNAFASHERNFEPYDRILFQEGTVDPRQTVQFSLLITDLTPTYQFHLVQDPRIPFS